MSDTDDDPTFASELKLLVDEVLRGKTRAELEAGVDQMAMAYLKYHRSASAALGKVESLLEQYPEWAVEHKDFWYMVYQRIYEFRAVDSGYVVPPYAIM